MPTITLTPNQVDPLTVLDGRGKDLDSTRWAYKFSGGYGLDVAMVDELRIDERRKSLWIPIADGNRQDDVGDVLEVGGIRADRHRLNPIVLFDHGKQVTLPIGLAEDRETKAYTFEIDPMSRTAGMEAFFYEGKGIGGVERDKEYDHAVFCDQLFDLAAKRLIRAGSIGYKVIKAEQIPADYREGKPQGLHLLSVLLLEGSLVVLPANGDTVRKMLGMPQVCGKPLSPWLVKSLTPMLTEETKTVSGYEAKAPSPRYRVGEVVESTTSRTGMPSGFPGKVVEVTKVTGRRNKFENYRYRVDFGTANLSGRQSVGWLDEDVLEPSTGQVKSTNATPAKGKSIKKREVDDAAAKYQSAMSQYGENNMTTQRAEIRYYELKQKWEDETGQKYGKIKAVEDSDIPPAKWKPGVGAVKDLRAKYGRKSMDENDTPDQARQYGSDDWRHGVQLSGNPYKRQDLRQAWEQGWKEKKRAEMGEKGMGKAGKALSQDVKLKLRSGDSSKWPAETTVRELVEIAKRKFGKDYRDVVKRTYGGGSQIEVLYTKHGYGGWSVGRAVTYDEVDQTEAKSLNPADLRAKYRNVKSARRRVKSSRPGSSMIRVHGKDLEAVQQAATQKGVKFERAGNANGLEKVRLTGDDGAIDGIAKQYGRRVKGMLYSIVQTVTPDAGKIIRGSGFPVGSYEVDFDFSEAKARTRAETFNRHAWNGVTYTVEAVDEESPKRKPPTKSLSRVKDLEQVFPENHQNYDRIFYDPEEGKYYDRARDIYITLEEAQRAFGVKGIRLGKGSKSMSRQTKALPEDVEDTEGHADEKYSAQVLKQLHKDHNTLLQSYDEMRGPLEHPEIDALVAEFLEGIVEGIEKIEAAYTKHHPDAEPLGKDLEAEDVDSGIEEEQNGDEVAAVDADVDEEEEFTPEEKRLAARRTKALRNGYKRKGVEVGQIYKSDTGTSWVVKEVRGDGKVKVERQDRPGDTYWWDKSSLTEVAGMNRVKAICPECGKEDCQCGKSLRNGKRKDMDEEVGEVRDDLEEVGEELEDVEEYGKALEPHETAAIGETAGFLKSDVMEGTDWTEESRMKAYHYHKALDGIAQVEGLSETVGNEEVETKARDSAGGGWDNPKEQRAAAARMTEEEDWEEYPKSLEVSKQKARDSAGGGWNNRKEQRAAAARMTEEEDWEEYPKSLKGKKTKAAPGTPEWEAEEATEPEHKMHPHRKMCKDASGFLKELSASNELAEEMRTKAGDWHKQLDEIVNPPQKEEEVVEPGEMGQKSVQTILLEDIEADGIPISKAQSEARAMGLQVATVPYGVEVTGEQSGLDAYLRKLGLQGNSGSYLKSLYAKRMKALLNYQSKAMEELNGRLASLSL